MRASANFSKGILAVVAVQCWSSVYIRSPSWLGFTFDFFIQVNIPLPVDDETTKDCRLPHRIPFESVDKTVAGFLLARATWSTQRRTKECREKDSPEQVWAFYRIPVDTADTDTSSIVNREDRPQRTTFRTIVDKREHDAYELTYSEIVREEPLPSLFGAIGSIFGPVDVSRKLKPMRRLVPRQQNISTTTLQLMVNIQAAANLPTRNDGQIHPFVEVSFQNNSMCTHQGSGRHPNWQHSLSLPVSGADDPKSITDTIQLNVYDQVQDSNDRGVVIHMLSAYIIQCHDILNLTNFTKESDYKALLLNCEYTRDAAI
uniref:C2 domain-containing protein n=1 Tax=Angiostrongylus cantonensis TaxID=6313 RepID=A0A0K0DE10_ANGCA